MAYAYPMRDETAYRRYSYIPVYTNTEVQQKEFPTKIMGRKCRDMKHVHSSWGVSKKLPLTLHLFGSPAISDVPCWMYSFIHGIHLFTTSASNYLCISRCTSQTILYREKCTKISMIWDATEK
jgi:hypothetical protein